MPSAKKRTKLKKIAGVAIEPARRKKNPPRTAFKKGGPNPHAFVAGNGSPNPGGKPRLVDHLLSKSLRVALCDRAPDEVAKSFNLPSGASWAQCIARKLIYMAVRGDLQACREIREATEGTRLHADLTFPDPSAAPPVISVVFLDSDGDGRPAPGMTIEAKPALPLPPPAPPELPASTD